MTEGDKSEFVEPSPAGGYPYPLGYGYPNGLPIIKSDSVSPDSLFLFSRKPPLSPVKVTIPKRPVRTTRQRAQAVMWVLATVAMVLATTFLGLLLAVWAHWVILFWW